MSTYAEVNEEWAERARMKSEARDMTAERVRQAKEKDPDLTHSEIGIRFGISSTKVRNILGQRRAYSKSGHAG